MRKFLIALCLIIASICCFSACSCGGGGGESEKQLTLQVDSYSLELGETFQITATQKPDGELVFESENESVATVSATGLVTGVAVGTAKINASVGEATASCVITVYEEVVESKLAFLVDEAQVLVDGSTFALSLFYEDALLTDGATYTVADPTIAEVDEQGVVKGLKEGETIVTATYNGFTATCKIKVKDIYELSVSSAVVLVKPNESAELTATANVGKDLAEVEDPEIEWTIADESIATVVGEKGNATIMGVSGGMTTLTASYNGASVDVTVSVAQTITTFEELATLAPVKNAYIVLGADIDLSTATWTVTNSTSTPSSIIPELKAKLDGNGKKMSGLTLTTALTNANGYTKLSNIGCFGYITGSVENLIFEGSLGGYTDETKTNVLSVAKMHLGLFAWKNAGTIKNCYIKGEIVNKPNFSSTVFTTVGAVYMNSGSMENVMTDMLFVRGTSSSTAAAVSHSAFAFAVSNTGKVENCVTVMSQYGETEKVSNSGVRIWTTVELGTEAKGEATYSWNVPFTVDGNSIYPVGVGSVYTGNAFYEEKAMPDQNRSNCYIFEDYEDLISDTGVGYNDDNKVEFGTNVKGSSYTEKTGADGKSALGSAWTFDTETGAIKLCGTVVWQADE